MTEQQLRELFDEWFYDCPSPVVNESTAFEAGYRAGIEAAAKFAEDWPGYADTGFPAGIRKLAELNERK